MMWALVSNNKVVELFHEQPDFAPGYPVFDGPPNVALGWDYDPATGNMTAPPGRTLDDVRAEKAAAINQACADTIVSGYKSSALGPVYTYPSKPTDQTNMLGSVLGSLLPGLSPTWSTPFWVGDINGVWSFKNHTAAQIQQAGYDGKYAVAVAQIKNATLQAQIAAATSEDAINAIVW